MRYILKQVNTFLLSNAPLQSVFKLRQSMVCEYHIQYYIEVRNIYADDKAITVAHNTSTSKQQAFWNL